MADWTRTRREKEESKQGPPDLDVGAQLRHFPEKGKVGWILQALEDWRWRCPKGQWTDGSALGRQCQSVIIAWLPKPYR